MEKFEEFIALLKENIEEEECNQCQTSDKVEYDTDIKFDMLIKDSEHRINWINEWYNDHRNDMAKRQIIRLGENLVKILELLKEE